MYIPTHKRGLGQREREREMDLRMHTKKKITVLV